MTGWRMMTSRGWTQAALLLCALLWRAAATKRIPQNMDKNLLNVIKQNLRRNKDRPVNDDVNAQRVPPPALAPAPAPGRNRDTFDLKDILGLRGNKLNMSTERSAADVATSPALASMKSRPGRATPRRLAPAPPSPLRKRFSFTKGTRSAPDKAAPADILDMAPAKGNRINAKREKGRLCQRHVLLPEGPKYDAWGSPYLLAHSAHRPFPNTRAPRLLLPACCNCCKKSVLGCE